MGPPSYMYVVRRWPKRRYAAHDCTLFAQVQWSKLLGDKNNFRDYQKVRS